MTWQEWTDTFYQAVLSANHQLKEDGIYYGANGALRMARDWGYGLAGLSEKQAKDAIQHSYGSLCVRLYNLKPPIDGKAWMQEAYKAAARK